MNIALIRAKYNPFGGAERFVESAIGALAAKGVELTILTRVWPSTANQSLNHVVLNPRYLTATGRDKSFAKMVRLHLSSTRYDLVQSHERIVGCDIFRAGDGVHAEWLAQRSRVSDAIKRFGTAINPHHRYMCRAEREMFLSPKLRAVICNSAMVKADIQRHFDVADTKLRVILTGVDSEKFHPNLRNEFRIEFRKKLSIPQGARVALFVGSGFERKGLAGFLLGLAELSGNTSVSRSSIRGIVVGEDKHLTRYRYLADQLGLTDHLIFTGGVKDVRPYYAASDVFVLPTLYDPMPNACLEAMACGLPTITSKSSGAAELITNGVEGFVTDALDTPAISNAIAHAFEDVNMGIRARARVAELTLEAMAAAYVSLYRELLELPP